MRKRTIFLAFVLTLVMTVTGAFSVLPAYAAADDMTLYAIYLTVNTGQKPSAGDEQEYGDAVLMESKGEYLLMDTGAPYVSDSMINYVRKVLPAGKKLNVYISHMHTDHYGGLGKLSKKVPIGTVYLPDKKTIGTDYRSSSSSGEGTIDAILRVYIFGDADINENQVVWLRKGSKFRVGSVSANVLGPVGSYKMSSFKNDKYGKADGHYLNNYSLTTMFTTAGGVKFLTTGDIETSEESKLVKAYGGNLKADILKLSHHGLKSSNSESFIKSVRPLYAVAENMGYEAATKDDSGNVVQRTNSAVKTVQKYGMQYLVANEKASLGIKVTGRNVWLYRDKNNNGSLEIGEKLVKWVKVAGIAPKSQKNFTGDDHFYIDKKTGKPKTGIKKIGKKYYKFSKGGVLEKAYYKGSVNRRYRNYGTAKNPKLCYFSKPDKNGKASVAVGFKKVQGSYYYFNKKTGIRYTPKKGTKGSKWKIKKIGKYKYAFYAGSGRVFNYKAKSSASLSIGGKKYTFDKKGRRK